MFRSSSLSCAYRPLDRLVAYHSYPQDYSAFDKAMAWLSIPTPFLGYAILLFF